MNFVFARIMAGKCEEVIGVVMKCGTVINRISHFIVWIGLSVAILMLGYELLRFVHRPLFSWLYSESYIDLDLPSSHGRYRPKRRDGERAQRMRGVRNYRNRKMSVAEFHKPRPHYEAINYQNSPTEFNDFHPDISYQRIGQAPPVHLPQVPVQPLPAASYNVPQLNNQMVVQQQMQAAAMQMQASASMMQAQALMMQQYQQMPQYGHHNMMPSMGMNQSGLDSNSSPRTKLKYLLTQLCMGGAEGLQRLITLIEKEFDIIDHLLAGERGYVIEQAVKDRNIAIYRSPPIVDETFKYILHLATNYAKKIRKQQSMHRSWYKKKSHELSTKRNEKKRYLHTLKDALGQYYKIVQGNYFSFPSLSNPYS
jgi:hypothetical protein